MKYVPDQDYRDKIANIKRLAANVRARKRPFELTPLDESQRAQIEDVTRFEQMRGLVLKQNFNRQRP